MTESPYFHVCFAVPDIDAAMHELVNMIGVSFGEPISSRLGEWDYTLVFTDTHPHIELISSVPGSPWETDRPVFHHLGLWTSCMGDTLGNWRNNGGTTVFDGREHGRSFAYVDAPCSGVRLEAVDVVQKQRFVDRWLR